MLGKVSGSVPIIHPVVAIGADLKGHIPYDVGRLLVAATVAVRNPVDAGGEALDGQTDNGRHWRISDRSGCFRSEPILARILPNGTPRLIRNGNRSVQIDKKN